MIILTDIPPIDDEDDTILNSTGAGTSNGGPTGIGEPDGDFYASKVGQMANAIISMKECVSSLEEVKDILSDLNDQFPMIDFNENVDLLHTSMAGIISNSNPNMSFSEASVLAGQGVLASSVSAALSSLPGAVVQEVIDAINDMSCGRTGGDEGDRDTAAEEDRICNEAIADFETAHGLTLSKGQKLAIKRNVNSCAGENFEAKTWEVILEDFAVFDEQANPCEKQLLIQYPAQAYQI